MSDDKSLRTKLREMLMRELEEHSTSDAAGPYSTPFAFANSGDFPGTKMKSKKLTQKEVKETAEMMDVIEKELNSDKLSEGSRYNAFKNDPSGNPPQKIGRAISEINRQLKELSRVVEMSARLKVEGNVSSSHLWKRTGRHLAKMENNLLKISRRIRELKA